MITGIGKDEEDNPLVYFGLSPQNIERMQAGEPVRVPTERLKKMGFEHPMTVVIEAVKSNEQGAREMAEQHPEAKVTSDHPNCLHCALLDTISLFAVEHRDRRVETLVGNIAQALGEAAGEMMARTRSTHRFEEVFDRLMGVARESANEKIDFIKREPTVQ